MTQDALDAIDAAIARARRYAAEARAEAEDDLERIRRENPDFAQLADALRALCGGRVTYLAEYATGKTWGEPVEEKAKRNTDNGVQGIGVSVPASKAHRRSKRRG